ncbi:MAG TPA: DNA internalization-related competence protein ComEC/Rec2, partial [Frankiaceae bacterium]|nr:DNA internalization-related competence protein ComEC/Rec2 [Frankiaceae bacterium]
GPPSEWQRLAGSLRAGLRKACLRLPADARGLLPGLVVGDTTELPADLADDARSAGLSHLTAVSGANCAIVLALVLALVRPTRLGRRGRGAVAFLGLVGFVILARPSPSVLRAALMGGIALLALALGRQRAAVPALLGAAMLLVLVDPDLALDPGFALSVLATGSLLLIAPAWAEAFARRMPRWAAEVLAIPLAAQVAVTPVVVLLSGSISLAAVPANLLAAPAVPVATVLGVLVVVLAPVAGGPAAHVAAVGGWPCSWIAAVAHRMAHVRGGSLAWPQTGLGALLAVLVVATTVAVIRRRRSRRLLVAAVCGIVLAALLVPRTLPSWPLPGWRLLACDVGQGDALLLRGEGNEPPVLVDTGPDPRPLRDCLGRLGIRRLSAVVLSHLHADHVEGLPAVLGRISVPVVFVNPLDEPALEGRRVRGWAARAGAPVTVLQAGEHLTAGGVSLDVVAPVRVLHGTESDPNNDSLVLLARAGGLSVLMTGDVEPEGQAALLARGVPHVDVLKVPHHGSAHQDDRFLAATGARVAVASVGRDNPYGHPSGRTLQTLAREGMVAMRTDLDGGVALAPAAGAPRVLPQRSGTRPALQAAVLQPDRHAGLIPPSARQAERTVGPTPDGADPTGPSQRASDVPRSRARAPPAHPLPGRRRPARRRAP